MKKIFALTFTIFLTLFFTLSFFPVTAFAASYTITVSGSHDMNAYSDNSVLTISGDNLNVSLTNTNSKVFFNFLIQCTGTNINLTINDLTIWKTGGNTSAIAFDGTGHTLTLGGDQGHSSLLSAHENSAGIQVLNGSDLTITGDGYLEVHGGSYGAGIGSAYNTDAGSITIESGNIDARGGIDSAGIGGGAGVDAANGGDVGAIVINGGNVKATGNGRGAGIGGGGSENLSGGRFTEITINGGTVSATSSEEGAAIGSGGRCNDNIRQIAIYDANVTAKSQGGGAGIGGGYNTNGGTITITGSTVNATSNEGAGIGGGQNAGGGAITITDSVVSSESKKGGAGIGGGRGGKGGTTELNNSNITSLSSEGGAGIGGGHNSEGGTITVTGGTIESSGLTGGGAGIGGGYHGDSGTINIGGDAQITAKSGNYGAGIGGGSEGNGVIIAIKSSDVVSTGGYGGAGIGGGDGGNGGTISISGSNITASGENMAAGIGGGSGGESGNIFILSSLIFARTGQETCNDIGGDVAGGSIMLSSDSIVFVGNDRVGSPLITDLIHFGLTPADSNNEIYGTKIPDGWTGSGGYNKGSITVSYDINGALGTTPQSNSVLKGTSAQLPTSIGLTNGSLTLLNWNTEREGNGMGYSPGRSYKFSDSTTLYAVWGDEDVTSVEIINAEHLTLTQGEKVRLMAEVLPADATKKTVSWSTSNSGIAGVASDGTVTAYGKGDCTVTASADGKSDTCSVTVSEVPVTKVSLNYGSKSMYVGDWFMLKTTISPSGASDSSVRWKSSDTSVAAVTGGVVTAVGTGSCTITATAGGISDTCKVTVQPKPDVDVSSVNISVDSVFTAVLYVGDTMMLSANVSPSEATDQSVTWQSSDSSIASVTSLGKVTAVSEGSVTITAAAQDKTAAYSITVKSSEEPVGTPVPSPSPSPTPDTEDTAEAVITVKLDMTQLPEGTKYIKLPNGEIIELTGEEEISVIVPQESVAADGTIEIVALDEGQVPLGSVNAEPEYIEDEDDMQEASAPVWKMIVMLLAGLAVGAAGAVIAIRLIVARKRA